MADIDIVPKRRSYLWLWIVIALVILTVVWFAVSGGTRPSRVGIAVMPESPGATIHLAGVSA